MPILTRLPEFQIVQTFRLLQAALTWGNKACDDSKPLTRHANNLQGLRAYRDNSRKDIGYSNCPWNWLACGGIRPERILPSNSAPPDTYQLFPAVWGP